jgi:hypothetical protein
MRGIVVGLALGVLMSCPAQAAERQARPTAGKSQAIGDLSAPLLATRVGLTRQIHHPIRFTVGSKLTASTYRGRHLKRSRFGRIHIEGIRRLERMR